MTIRTSDFLIRINRVLPELSEVGSPDFSKRAAEIYQTKIKSQYFMFTVWTQKTN